MVDVNVGEKTHPLGLAPSMTGISDWISREPELSSLYFLTSIFKLLPYWFPYHDGPLNMYGEKLFLPYLASCFYKGILSRQQEK